MLLVRLAAACAALSVLAQLFQITIAAQPNHSPLTILRQRVIGSRGATLIATNPATPFSLSGVVGLSAIGFLKAERSSTVVGFWVPRGLITSTEPHEDVTAGNRSWVWPNPFASELHISIDKPRAMAADAQVFDMLGNHLAELLWDGDRSRGIQFSWNGIDKHGNPIATGAYLLRVRIRELAGSQETLYSTVVTCKR